MLYLCGVKSKHMETTNLTIKTNDTVGVMIIGKQVDVEVFCNDGKHIYFTDPSFKDIPELKNKLYSRRINSDIIIVKPTHIYPQ